MQTDTLRSPNVHLYLSGRQVWCVLCLKCFWGFKATEWTVYLWTSSHIFFNEYYNKLKIYSQEMLDLQFQSVLSKYIHLAELAAPPSTVVLNRLVCRRTAPCNYTVSTICYTSFIWLSINTSYQWCLLMANWCVELDNSRYNIKNSQGLCRTYCSIFWKYTYKESVNS